MITSRNCDNEIDVEINGFADNKEAAWDLFEQFYGKQIHKSQRKMLA